MPRFNKRPLNRCGGCGHTWYPRGHNTSAKCPNCGAVLTYTPSNPLAGCGVLFALVVGGGAMLCAFGGLMSAIRGCGHTDETQRVAPPTLAIIEDAGVADARPDVVDAGRKKAAAKPSATFTVSPTLSAMLDERARTTAPSATTSKDADTSGAGF